MSDEERHLFQQIIASFDSPAYMRRARDVEAVWNEVLMRCQRRYTELLEMPRLRLAQLEASVVGRLDDLPKLTIGRVSTAQAAQLQALFDAWQPKLQGQHIHSVSVQRIDQAFQQLKATFDRFNRLWQKTLEQIDLSEVNRQRHDYNQYYLLEKECVVHSPTLARIGFEPLNVVTTQDLLQRFPMLPESLVSVQQTEACADDGWDDTRGR